MLRKALFLWLVSAALALTFFIIRQRALNDLRSGNESLRRETEVVKENPSEPVQEPSPGSQVDPLSTEERNELLRLRSQIPSLRSEATAASNRVAAPDPVQRTPGARTTVGSGEPPDVMRQFRESESYGSAELVAGALFRYVRGHSYQTPEDLASLKEAAPALALTDEMLQRFELIRKGTVPDHPWGEPYVLLAREKEPRQLSDGTWVRIYVQANGGLIVAGPMSSKPDPDDSQFLAAVEAQRLKATVPR